MQSINMRAEHSIEHAMSAYHQELPHGAGLIMISKAFHEFFIEKYACDERFIAMAKAIGIKDTDKQDEFDMIERNARERISGLFAANPCEMSHEDVLEVLIKSYR